MENSKETDILTKISDIYFDKKLAGANELYHIYLRELVIPRNGGKSALELGCGKGLWTKVLCERYDEVDVVEASEKLIYKVAHENIVYQDKLNLHSLPVESFAPGRDKTWQHIYMTFLLEHLKSPVNVLKNIKNFLAKGGSLFLAVPNADSVHRAVAVRMGLIPHVGALSDNDLSVGHRRVYTCSQLRRHVLEAGFKIVWEKPVGLKPLNLKQMETWPSKMVWAFCKSGDLTPKNSAYIALKATHT